MELLDLLKERYSCRKFKNQPVEQEKIEKIIEAGRIAPTACNNQPQRILVIKSKEGLEKLQRCKFSRFNEQLAFLISYDKSECWVREFDKHKSGDIDASIVATHMMLEAKSLGIDSTWIMHFLPEAIKEEFEFGENIVPVALLVMGYADMKPSKLHYDKKNTDETVRYI